MNQCLNIIESPWLYTTILPESPFVYYMVLPNVQFVVLGNLHQYFNRPAGYVHSRKQWPTYRSSSISCQDDDTVLCPKGRTFFKIISCYLRIIYCQLCIKHPVGCNLLTNIDILSQNVSVKIHWVDYILFWQTPLDCWRGLLIYINWCITLSSVRAWCFSNLRI